MSTITISDLTCSSKDESFITEFNGLSVSDKASLMKNIISGGIKIKIKFNDDGSIKSIKYKD